MCKYIGNDRSVVRHERRIGWWPHRLGHGYWIPFVAVPRGKGGRLAAIPLVEEGLQAARDFMARVASLLSAYGALRHALHPGRSPCHSDKPPCRATDVTLVAISPSGLHGPGPHLAGLPASPGGPTIRRRTESLRDA